MLCVCFKNIKEQLDLVRSFIQFHHSTAVYNDWLLNLICMSYIRVFLGSPVVLRCRTLRQNDPLSASDNRSILVSDNRSQDLSNP